MNYRYIILFITFFSLTLGANLYALGSDEDGEYLEGDIEIAGSSTVFPITMAIAEEFVIQNPKVTIPIRSTGTGGGFKNFFVNGTTDINNASRHIKPSEVRTARQNGIEAIELQVAIDAISIIVNNDNPVNSMTTDELKEIWDPQSPPKTWNAVNSSWPTLSLELYGPSSASGTFDYFTEIIIGEEGRSRTDYQKTEQDNTIIKAIRGSKSALGYLGLAYYLENKDIIKVVQINGIAPSIESVRNGTYVPLARPIFIYVSSKSLARPEIQAFVLFYITHTNTSIISDVGYVPVTDDIMQANLEKITKEIAKYGKN